MYEVSHTCLKNAQFRAVTASPEYIAPKILRAETLSCHAAGYRPGLLRFGGVVDFDLEGLGDVVSGVEFHARFR